MTCYVCLEASGELVRDACGCRDAPVHAACLRQWVAHSRNARCAMCGHAYAGAELLPRAAARAEPRAAVARAARQVALVGAFGGLTWFVAAALSRARREPCVECVLADGVAVALVGAAYVALAWHLRARPAVV